MPGYNVFPPKRKWRLNLDEDQGDVIPPGTSPGKLNQPYLLDMVNCEKLFLQTIPLELNYAPETSWAVIASPGRNTPLYQYTGAEDTLSFTINWYAEELNKEDVIRKAKWVEALGKNNGYDEKPHHIKFIFGKLFQDAEWIVSAMPVKFSLFDRSEGMLPCLATQEITLKRINSNNRLRNAILKIDT